MHVEFLERICIGGRHASFTAGLMVFLQPGRLSDKHMRVNLTLNVILVSV